jgi:hypothetical protein
MGKLSVMSAAKEKIFPGKIAAWLAVLFIILAATGTPVAVAKTPCTLPNRAGENSVAAVQSRLAQSPQTPDLQWENSIGRYDLALDDTLAAKSTAPSLNAGTRVGPEFDPVKLQNILSAYERQGGTVITGESAQSILSNIGANAAYYPVEGGPGALIIQPGATRLEVTEELMHLGQFRAAGWPSSSPFANPGLNVQFELDAQDRLLNLAQRQNWSAAEINKILQNQQTWLNVVGKGE